MGKAPKSLYVAVPIGILILVALFVVPVPGDWICDLSIRIDSWYVSPIPISEHILSPDVTVYASHWRRQTVLELVHTPQFTWWWTTGIDFDIWLIDSEGNIRGPWKASVEIPEWQSLYFFIVEIVVQGVPEGTYTLKIDSSMVFVDGSYTFSKNITITRGV